jgi:hypothetical protein
MRSFARMSRAVTLATVCAVVMILPACGKKGDPTLKSYEKPDTPSSLSVIHREDSLILRWAYPQSKEYLITEFVVLRSTGADFEKLSHIAKDKRSFTDKDIKSGGTYTYKVISQNARGVYSNDSGTAVAEPVQVPLPPEGLSYSVAGNSVILSWKPLAAGVRYNVYKAAEKGAYGLAPLNPTPLTEPEFRDAFSVNKIAHYTVRSLTGSVIRDEGPSSEEITVDPADLVPARPVNLQAFPAADRIFLSWSESPEPWATGFRVYKRSGGADFVLIGQTQIPTFVDKEPSDISRDYRITAVGPAKEGPAAEIQNVIHIPQR